MHRRAFITGTAAGAVAGTQALAAITFASESGSGAARIETYVTSLRDYVGSASLPAPGSAVTLVRVRGRAFDPLSVAVLAEDGRQLGFLPGAHGGVIAPLIDAGLRFGANVSATRQGPAPRLGLQLELLGPVRQS